jgi:soluble P-type ATPase
MKYNPTGVGEIELNNIILDLNGTLAVNGKLVGGVKKRINKLRELGYKVYLFTGDQRGTATVQAQELGIEVQRASNTEEKRALTKQLNGEQTVSIGNARIDIGTFEPVKLRIGTLQSEGIHTEILKYIDILVPSINDALDLLIDPNIFNATMRK